MIPCIALLLTTHHQNYKNYKKKIFHDPVRNLNNQMDGPSYDMNIIA